ncbi:conserved exported hypothetical protein [uncultured Stenotrophomonas sp.]|uniref:DUF5625 domain-containing protein n=1 Tax=uncultured Stenotrophomonas sp. TaxID=165438 RepID=A0A1Y5Q6G2_9GAMM|nr:conserved exported hypothetical protein [uncultured Stenotrophomonas sp.]
MREFLRKQRRLLLLLALLAIWLSLFTAWAYWVTADPLNAPIALTPAGMVDKKIHVVVPEHYTLVFRFKRAGQPYEQLRTLLGGAASTTAGIPIPIRWSLATVSDGRILASGEVDSAGISAWSSADIERKIGGIRVPSGRYRFKAQVLRGIPELAHIDTRLAMRGTPKASSTWQISLVWWGSIANMLLLAPLAVLLLLLLLWRAGRAAFHAAKKAASQES